MARPREGRMLTVLGGVGLVAGGLTALVGFTVWGDGDMGIVAPAADTLHDLKTQGAITIAILFIGFGAVLMGLGTGLGLLRDICDRLAKLNGEEEHAEEQDGKRAAAVGRVAGRAVGRVVGQARK